MLLTYEAVTNDGRHETDVVEAPDVKEAVEQLRRRGLYVSRIEEGTPSATKSKRSPTHVGGTRLPIKTTMLLTRQMAMLLRAGSSVVPAVSAIRRQTSKPTHVALLNTIVADLEQGAPLTDAFRKHPRTFDPVYCAIVAAGEASATLTEMFERLAVIVGKRRAVRNQVISALAYPALLIGMAMHIVVALLLFVIPRFAGMFKQLSVEPPASTRFLMSVSTTLRDHWVVLVTCVIFGGATIVAFLMSTRGRQWLCDVQLSVPVLGRLRSAMIQASIFRTMGTLLESGVGVLDTFELARESTRNRKIQGLFDDLEGTVTAGGSLAPSFEASGLVQPFICQAIHTGEDSGNLGGALTYAADLLDETNAELITTTMKLLEPAILIGLGFVVGGVAISLFLPLFDMTAAIG